MEYQSSSKRTVLLSEFGEEEWWIFGVVYTGVFMVKFEQDVNDLSKFWYCALSLILVSDDNIDCDTI